jgi:hypothetical protein
MFVSSPVRTEVQRIDGENRGQIIALRARVQSAASAQSSTLKKSARDFALFSLEDRRVE